MWLGRVRCALALGCLAACSFPDYQRTAAPGPGGQTASCDNHVRDGDEIGVDCGPSCEPCPLCSDGTQNGDETGVDCGGGCGPCPRCDDGQQNGSESDVDCGGVCSARCNTDQRCQSSADCESLICASVCQPADCRDHVRNGLETGVDCGGACPPCGNGSACQGDADCESQRCQDALCVSPGCTDQIVNGQETDVDCGGQDCAPCASGQACTDGGDCLSRLCRDDACAAPSCGDSTQNQGESDVDCGGASCDPCATGEACFDAADCATGLCQSGMCVPAEGGGKPLSKIGWSITTSESATEQAPEHAVDGDVDTCWTSGAMQHAGMYVELDLGQPHYFFKILLRVTAAECKADAPQELNVYVSKDGTFGDPVLPPVYGSEWTWLDFPSAQVGRYVRFELTQDVPREWSIGTIELWD